MGQKEVGEKLRKEMGLSQYGDADCKLYNQNNFLAADVIKERAAAILENESSIKTSIKKENIFSAADTVQKYMYQQRKAFPTFNFETIKYVQKNMAQHSEFKKKILLANQEWIPIIRNQSGFFDAIRDFNASMNNTLFSLQKNIESMLPNILVAVNSIKDIVQELDATINDDAKIRVYSDNPLFWKNVRLVSRELIVIPEGVSDELLDYLCKESYDYKEVKRLIGESDITELENELKTNEHNNFMFKDYLLEIMQLHQANPDNYRVYIPALFTVIEGTLSEILKISEQGTAFEIKRKMDVIWDLYNYVYLNHEVGITFSFWNQLLLTNTKEIFKRLTVNSKNAGLKINRNAILHGKSNPAEWNYEDFMTLVSLIKTILFTRRTTDILISEFLEMIDDELYDGEELSFIEYEISIRDRYSREKSKQERSRITSKLKKDMEKDLCHLFTEEPETARSIITKSNFQDVIGSLFKNL